MVRLVRWMLVPALFGWSFAAAPVAAQNRSEFVQDEANLFSKDAKAKANAEIAQIWSQFKKEFVVDTVYSVKVPEKTDKTAYLDEWAQKRFANEKVNGVYAIIVVDPATIRVELGNRTKTSGLFDEPDRQDLRNQIIANMKEIRSDPTDQGKKDHVLLAATKLVHDRMTRHKQLASGAQQTPAAPHPAAKVGDTPSWLPFVVIAIVFLLVFWLIRAVMRGLSGGGAGGPGMAGGGYGGGGGGFFSSMLGGLFGAAAGMWMYNNFFGGHGNSAWGAGPDGGSSPSTGNDADTSSTGDGGDYGDSGGGGDAGGGDAGGGDWGGGGGGDWGGGGGDFGGGGGGDW